MGVRWGLMGLEGLVRVEGCVWLLSILASTPIIFIMVSGVFSGV